MGGWPLDCGVGCLPVEICALKPVSWYGRLAFRLWSIGVFTCRDLCTEACELVWEVGL